MGRFVKKRKSTDDSDVADVSGSGLNIKINIKRSKTKSVKVRRKYADDYLCFGFTWNDDLSCPLPVCVVCGEHLSNEAMVPSKLKRHLTTKHPGESSKPRLYFERLLSSIEKPAPDATRNATVSDRALEASFRVAELIAKNMYPHVIGEQLIGPACSAAVETMLGDESRDLVRKVPLSKNTVSRRIAEMADDINEIVVAKIRAGKSFSLQIAESATRPGANGRLLLGFARFADGHGVVEQFLFCKDLGPADGKGGVFGVVDGFFDKSGLSWNHCCGVCTDGAQSATSSYGDFVRRVRDKNPAAIVTHCFVRREDLVSNTVGREMTQVLNDVVAMVDCIRRRRPPLESRIFESVRKEIGSDHSHLDTEIWWLSRGRVLDALVELGDELRSFFERENLPGYRGLLQDENWCCALAYLADIFKKLNDLYASMQGRQETIVSSTNKIRGFKNKIVFWRSSAVKGDFSNFPAFSKLTAGKSNTAQLQKLIIQHLVLLERKIDHYFPSLTKSPDWVVLPFDFTDAVDELDLDNDEKNEFIDMCSNSTTRIIFNSNKYTVDSFWLSLASQYPAISRKAILLLLPFTTSYLCERTFSTINKIKASTRIRLKNIEPDLCIAVTNFPPRILELCKKHQAQTSH